MVSKLVSFILKLGGSKYFQDLILFGKVRSKGVVRF